ncbi:hypothetical protein KEM54_005510 [Ascosphaera aggregata]|nr:hypothetical protein KEM54_005510 [Ascosphaera aggregata]
MTSANFLNTKIRLLSSNPSLHSTWAVAGTNLATTFFTEDWKEGFSRGIGELLVQPQRISKNPAWATSALQSNYVSSYEETGFAPYAATWRARLVFLAVNLAVWFRPTIRRISFYIWSYLSAHVVQGSNGPRLYDSHVIRQLCGLHLIWVPVGRNVRICLACGNSLSMRLSSLMALPGEGFPESIYVLENLPHVALI